eukprot:g138.t1
MKKALLKIACFFLSLTLLPPTVASIKILLLAPAKLGGGLGDDAILHSMLTEIKERLPHASISLGLKDIARGENDPDVAFQNYALGMFGDRADEFLDISREYYLGGSEFSRLSSRYDRVFFTPTDRVDGYYGCEGNAMRWLQNVALAASVTNVTVVGYSFDIRKAKVHCPSVLSWFRELWTGKTVVSDSLLLLPRDIGSYRSTIQAVEGGIVSDDCRCHGNEYIRARREGRVYKCESDSGSFRLCKNGEFFKGLGENTIYRCVDGFVRPVDSWSDCVAVGRSCTNPFKIRDTCTRGIHFTTTPMETIEIGPESLASSANNVVVRLAADPAFHLRPAPLATNEADIWYHERVIHAVSWIRRQRGKFGRVVVAMNANLHGNAQVGGGRASYLAQAVSSVTNLIQNENAAVILVAHDFRRGQSDSDFARKIYVGVVSELRETSKSVDGSTHLHLFAEGSIGNRFRYYTARHVKQIIQRVDLVFSGRMHLAICAIGSSVPAIVISHQPKYRELMSWFGLENSAVLKSDKICRTGDVATTTNSMVDFFSNWIRNDAYKRARRQIVDALPIIKSLSRFNFALRARECSSSSSSSSSSYVVHQVENPTLFHHMLRRSFPDRSLQSHSHAGALVEYILRREETIDEMSPQIVLHVEWLGSFLCHVGDAPAKTLIRWLNSGGPSRSRISVVWSIHNRRVHDRRCRGATRETEAELRKALANHASLIHAMCPHTLDIAKEDGYPVPRNTPVAVVSHSGYQGTEALPSLRRLQERRETFRQAQGIAKDEIVFVVFGNLRQYKQIDEIVRSFGRVRRLIPRESRLIVVGERHRDVNSSSWLAADGVFVIERRIPANDLANVLVGSDVAVFNFDPVSFINSGSVMHALSVGLPVVAPNVGCLGAYLRNDFSILFDPTDHAGLDRALAESPRLIMNSHNGESSSAFVFAKSQDPNTMSILFRRQLELHAVNAYANLATGRALSVPDIDPRLYNSEGILLTPQVDGRLHVLHVPPRVDARETVDQFCARRGLLKTGCSETLMSVVESERRQSTGFQSFGAMYQDELVWTELFARGEPKLNGVYVEFGAHGNVGSNCLAFEKYGWTGLCVEPQPDYVAELRETGRACLVEDVAIGRERGIEEFVIPLRSGKARLAMGGLSRLSFWGDEDDTVAQKFNVTVVPAAVLLHRYGIHHIDFLSIDVEGAEHEVLQTIDFDVTTVDVVCMETGSILPVHFLLERGFVVWRVVFSDVIMVHERFLKEKGIEATEQDRDGGALREKIMDKCDRFAREQRGIVGRVKCRQTIMLDQLLLSGTSRESGYAVYYDRGKDGIYDVAPFA